jgi:uncharacterized protein YjbJ (UPF0337 family)
MKEDILKSRWTRLKGQLRRQWDRLTEDDVEDIGGDREVLLGMLQEYYGRNRSQSERDLQRWLDAQAAAVPKDRPRVKPAPTDAGGAGPVGVAIGTAGGAAAGAVAGSFGGPVGTLVGAAVGGLAGGLAGKAVGPVDPELEDAYWQSSYRSAPYVDRGHDYQYYQPAYRFGWESYSRYGRRSFDEIGRNPDARVGHPPRLLPPDLERGPGRRTRRLGARRAPGRARARFRQALPGTSQRLQEARSAAAVGRGPQAQARLSGEL